MAPQSIVWVVYNGKDLSSRIPILPAHGGQKSDSLVWNCLEIDPNPRSSWNAVRAPSELQSPPTLFYAENTPTTEGNPLRQPTP